jgi:hypothetical protein
VVAAWWLTDWVLRLDSVPWVRRACRDLGYFALLATAFPCLYVWRRFYLFRGSGSMTTLLRRHIGASYLAAALILIHSRGRFFGSTLTTWLVIALAAVILSGVVGYFAQKLVNRIMTLLVLREVGSADLARRRDELIRMSSEKVKNYSLLASEDILNWRKFASLFVRKKAYELRLEPPTETKAAMPADGKGLIVVVQERLALRFCIIDDDGDVVLDTDEGKLLQQAEQANRLDEEKTKIEKLSNQLKPFWPPRVLNDKEKDSIAGAVRTLLGRDETMLRRRMRDHFTFPRSANDALHAIRRTATPPADQVATAVDALNQQLQRDDVFQTAEAQRVKPSDELRAILAAAPHALSPREWERRNRLFLEAACPGLVRPSQALPQPVIRFFEDRVLGYLSQPFPSWRWLFTPAALEPVPRNHFLRVRALVPRRDQADVIDDLWDWVQERRQIDLEYWFHRLARLWLWVHGPATAALVGLVIAHVWLSIYHTGWF